MMGGINLTVHLEYDEVVERLKLEGWVAPVRCGECKHRIVNEHYGEKGYINLKAYCEFDTGDIYSLGRCAEDDNWFCADGERKGGDEL